MKGEGIVVPRIVVTQSDHPNAEPDEPDEGQGEGPVKGNRNQAVAVPAVLPHGVSPKGGGTPDSNHPYLRIPSIERKKCTVSDAGPRLLPAPKALRDRVTEPSNPVR